MSTLYNRATPLQQLMLRMVEGAVKNAADAHPDVYIPDWFARSVAKRAAGTLSAHFADVLAALPTPSDRAEAVNCTPPGLPDSQLWNCQQARLPADQPGRQPLPLNAGEGEV